MSEVTEILLRAQRGDESAAEDLLPVVYDELRRMARGRLASEKPGQTLQATALVHEVWLRLMLGDPKQHWHNRKHFFAVAGEAMRRLLVDQARRKNAIKRGAGAGQVSFELAEKELLLMPRPDEVLAVHEALDGLAATDPISAELVKLHYFSGFSIEEAATLLDLPRSTAYRRWIYARTWLRAALQDVPRQDSQDSWDG